jgi:hypothetical protein
MVIVWVLIWLGLAGLAYLFTEGAALCYGRRAWDRATRQFALVCGLLPGQVYLRISAELLLLATIGKGLGAGTPQRYFHGSSHSHHGVSRVTVDRSAPAKRFVVSALRT